MKIAMLTTPKGGAFTHSVILCNALLHLGHQVLLLGANKPFLEIPFCKTARSISTLPNFVMNKNKLLNRIRAFQPDLLHAHAPSGNADFMVAGFSKALRIPLVFSYHVVPFQKRTPIDLAMYAYFRLAEKTMANADALICPTRQIEQALRRSRLIDSRAIHIVPYGVDTDTYRPRASKRPGKLLRMLFVGRIHPEKGMGLLLKAMLLLNRDYELTIIGNSPYVKYYQSRYHMTAPHVVWKDWIDSPEELATFYSEADITVFPSLWEEAFGLVVTESMACATPVVAFDYATSKEIIDHGMNGFILKNRTPRDMARFLENVCRSKLHRMGKLARKAVSCKFTTERMLKLTLRVYAHALTRRDTPVKAKALTDASAR